MIVRYYRRPALLLMIVSIAGLVPMIGHAQAKKKPPVKQGENTRGTAQVAGKEGEFGTTYSLKSGFNMRITSAEYTIERFVSYENMLPKPEEKLLLLHVALKNAEKDDQFFDASAHEITVVDEKDNDFKSHNWRRDSDPTKESGITLKPGQGVEDMTVCIAVPAHVALKKIILSQGRFGTGDEVIRFPLDNPKNKITPLPEYARDPADKTGAFTLPELPAKIGQFYPEGALDLKVNSIAYTDDTYNNEKAEEGKRFLVVNVTAKSRIPQDATLFEITQGELFLKDADGEKIPAFKDNGFRKAKADEEANPTLKQNEEITFRIFFAVPKTSKLKVLNLSENGARSLVYDISNVK